MTIDITIADGGIRESTEAKYNVEAGKYLKGTK